MQFYVCLKREKIFPRNNTKKHQACKNLSKNWHFIIIHLFFDFFQFLYFSSASFSWIFFYSSYIHINYARLIIIMSYVHIRVDEMWESFLLALLKNWKKYFFLMECVCAVSVINEHASALLKQIGLVVVLFLLGRATDSLYACIMLTFSSSSSLNLLFFAPAMSN